MVRGRPMNTALPETRGLVQQRKFRAKKAEKIAELEATNLALVEENKQLRTEIQLLRDHLLNPNAVNIPTSGPRKEIEVEDGEEIRIQMGVVQGVRDQLENALKSLRAIGGEMGGDGAQASPISMTSNSISGMTDRTPIPIHNTFTPPTQFREHVSYTTNPEITTTPAGPPSGTTKCCKPPSTRSVPPVPQQTQYEQPQSAHIQKRQRQGSPTMSEWMDPGHRQLPTGENEFTMPERPISSNQNFSPSMMGGRGVPPINGAECCLGIVACDEQGEILGWSS